MDITKIAAILRNFNHRRDDADAVATEIIALFKPWRDKLLEVNDFLLEVNDFLKDNAPFDPEIDELLIDTSDIPEAGENWLKRAVLTLPADMTLEQAQAMLSKYRKTWPETLATYRSMETPYRPYAVKPWHGNSYGPHVLAWVQALAYDVRDKFGRPEAVRLINLFGDAPTISEIQPKRYEILSRALRYKLTGTDPGPTDLWPSKSENPGIFESEIMP